jgi:hypothetical protein
MSRTGTSHALTIAIIMSLIFLRTDPPDKVMVKSRIEATRILSQLHLQSVQWLHHLYLINRLKTHKAGTWVGRRTLAWSNTIKYVNVNGLAWNKSQQAFV